MKCRLTAQTKKIKCGNYNPNLIKEVRFNPQTKEVHDMNGNFLGFGEITIEGQLSISSKINNQ